MGFYSAPQTLNWISSKGRKRNRREGNKRRKYSEVRQGGEVREERRIKLVEGGGKCGGSKRKGKGSGLV